MDVEKLRELERRATPGPWQDNPARQYGAVVSQSPTDDLGFDDADHVAAYGGHLIGESILPANRAFIVALRNAAPEIIEKLARIEKLERVAAVARELNIHAEWQSMKAALADLDGGKG